MIGLILIIAGVSIAFGFNIWYALQIKKFLKLDKENPKER